MLQGNFFSIHFIREEGDSVKAGLELNAGHPIFDGHFPGQPIVPGACMLQMVKELMQTVKGYDLQLIKAHQLKFISLIDPGKHSHLEMTITHSLTEMADIAVSATLATDTTTCFKFAGVFQLCK